MKLIQCRNSSGQRVPLLVQDGQAAPLPKLVPVILAKKSTRARGTARLFTSNSSWISTLRTLMSAGQTSH